MLIANIVKNLMPQVGRGNKSLDELWFDKKLSIAYLRVWGKLCFTYIPKEKRDKLDPVADVRIFLGYEEGLR